MDIKWTIIYWNYPFSALLGLLHDNTEELLSTSGINRGISYDTNPLIATLRVRFLIGKLGLGNPL